jgi:hypothetical protein
VTQSPEDIPVNLKRHGIIAAVATATLALAACGSDNPNDTPAGGSSSAAKSAIDCKTGSLTAQGSTAQKNAVDEWVKAYQQACTGAQINYQATGSGAGIQAFIGNTADFAGSDSTLKAGDEQTKADARCAGGKAINLPMVVGPIAVAYNLSGVKDLQFKAGHPRQDLRRRYHEVGRPRDQGGQPERTRCRRHPSPRCTARTLGYDGQLHQVPEGSRPHRLDLRREQGLEGAGRSGAARAMTASPPRSSKPPVRSATSNSRSSGQRTYRREDLQRCR